MKKFLIAVAAAWCTLLWAAPTLLIADFEKGTLTGWAVYSDAAKPGSIAFETEEAISGDRALKVTINGCGHYRGLSFHEACPMPEGAVAVSFLIKPLSGTPPECLALSQVEQRYGKRIYGARGYLHVKGDDWQKIRVEFAKMICDVPGPEYEKKARPLKPGLYAIAFYVPVAAQPSLFLIDDVKWELAK